jgi:hypothetical protein
LTTTTIWYNVVGIGTRIEGRYHHHSDYRQDRQSHSTCRGDANHPTWS